MAGMLNRRTRQTDTRSDLLLNQIELLVDVVVHLRPNEYWLLILKNSGPSNFIRLGVSRNTMDMLGGEDGAGLFTAY